MWSGRVGDGSNYEFADRPAAWRDSQWVSSGHWATGPERKTGGEKEEGHGGWKAGSGKEGGGVVSLGGGARDCRLEAASDPGDTYRCLKTDHSCARSLLPVTGGFSCSAIGSIACLPELGIKEGD